MSFFQRGGGTKNRLTELKPSVSRRMHGKATKTPRVEAMEAARKSATASTKLCATHGIRPPAVANSSENSRQRTTAARLGKPGNRVARSQRRARRGGLEVDPYIHRRRRPDRGSLWSSGDR